MGRRAASPIMKRKPALILVGVVAAASAAALALSASAMETRRTTGPTAESAESADDVETYASCGDGSYDAEVTQSGSTYSAPDYSGSSLRDAMQAAVNSLSDGRTSMESVVVNASGDVPAEDSLDLHSYTSIEICGTLNVTGTMTADQAPLKVKNAHDVEIAYLENMTGAPYFGIFVQNSDNVSMGQITMNLSGGLGIRVDNYDDTSEWTTDISIDTADISGASSHAVETYGVDGFTVGTLTATDVGESGLLLNQTINADIGTINATDAGTDTGYAAFRIANEAGAINGSYDTDNIHVDEVNATGGGRGIFCVSESGGLTIDRIDIADTGNNAILLENCYNVTIATASGTVDDGGEIRLAARDEFDNNRDITLSNLTVIDSAITEDPCGENIQYVNITYQNSEDNTC